MKLDSRSFAIGLLCALALVGCMMAVTNTNNSAGARYEVHWQETQVSSGGASYVVLDTTTGTTVTWSSTPPGEVRAFAAAP